MTPSRPLASRPPRSPHRRRVFLLGATGTIGQATAHALLQRGHEVVCLVRPRAGVGGRLSPTDTQQRLPGAELRMGEDRQDVVRIARTDLEGKGG